MCAGMAPEMDFAHKIRVNAACRAVQSIRAMNRNLAHVAAIDRHLLEAIPAST